MVHPWHHFVGAALASLRAELGLSGPQIQTARGLNTPSGYYVDNSPIYRFSTGGYPSRGVRKAGATHRDPESALAEGHAEVKRYCEAAPYARSGAVLGVAEVEGGFRAVINTYHSNS